MEIGAEQLRSVTEFVIIWLLYLRMSSLICHLQVKSILIECPSKNKFHTCQQVRKVWGDPKATTSPATSASLVLEELRFFRTLWPSSFYWIIAPILWNLGHKSLLGCWHLWFLDVSLHQAGSEFKFPVRNRWKRQFNRVRLNLSILIYKIHPMPSEFALDHGSHW